jgi:hypothetical protein
MIPSIVFAIVKQNGAMLGEGWDTVAESEINKMRRARWRSTQREYICLLKLKNPRKDEIGETWILEVD